MSDNACSPSTVFTWVGFIVVNSAFSAIIAWGSFQAWPLGLVLSLVYSVFLFYIAGRLEKKIEGSDSQDESTSNVAENKVGDDNDENAVGIRLLVSLTYALAVLGIGVTGSFLPINLFQCDSFGFRDYSDNFVGKWSTNVSSFPQDVQSWALNDGIYSPSSFIFLPNQGITLFSGDNGAEELGYGRRPWIISEPGSAPELISPYLLCADDFVLLTNDTDDTACFVGDVSNKTRDQLYYCQTNGISCFDGNSVQSISANAPENLFANNGTLWFKARSPESWEKLIYSLNPNTAETTLHSAYTSNEEGSGEYDNNSDCDEQNTRYIAITTFFVTALPVFAASIALWRKKCVSSMVVTGYGGLSAMVTTLYVIIDPTVSNLDEMLKWWFPLSSAIWLASAVILFLANRVREGSLTWSVNVGGIVFFVGMIILIGVPGEHDDLWRWAVLNLLCILPLVALGVITNAALVLVYGAVGILIDVYRITSLLTKGVAKNFELPIRFVVLAAAGFGLGYLGLILSRNQDNIQTSISGWSDGSLGWLRKVYKEPPSGDEEDTPIQENNDRSEKNTDGFVVTGVQIS